MRVAVAVTVWSITSALLIASGDRASPTTAAWIAGRPAIRQGDVSHYAYDGRVVIALDDHRAFAWNLASNSAPIEFSGHSEEIRALALSNDGRLLATGAGLATAVRESRDNSVRIWDVATGRELKRFSASAPVRRVAFTRDGSRVLSASEDGTLCVWDVKSGRSVLMRRAAVEGMHPIAGLSDDGRRAVALSFKGAVVFEIATGREICRLRPGPRDGHFLAAEFDPPGEHILTASFGGEARIWDVRTGKAQISVFKGDVAHFRDQGRQVITGSEDGKIVLWSAATGKRLATLSNKGAVLQLIMSRDGSRCLAEWKVESESGRPHEFGVTVCDLDAHMEIVRIPRSDGSTPVGFSADGRTFLMAGNSAVIRSAKTGGIAREFRLRPFGLAWSAGCGYAPPKFLARVVGQNDIK